MATRIVGLLVAIIAAVGATLGATGPAQAATPAIQITKVYYNSPGTDTGSNTGLNAERVRLSNTRTYTISLKEEGYSKCSTSDGYLRANSS